MDNDRRQGIRCKPYRALQGQGKLGYVIGPEKHPMPRAGLCFSENLASERQRRFHRFSRIWTPGLGSETDQYTCRVNKK